jgi:hypothetical protein
MSTTYTAMIIDDHGCDDSDDSDASDASVGVYSTQHKQRDM